MKRMIALLLFFAAIVTLCACGGEDVPSEEMIRADIETALAENNANVSLAKLETVKSLNEDNTWQATYTVFAETKYADWTYEVDVTYTKYDQGWMADDVDIADASYTLARVPSDDEMSELVNTFFSTYDDDRLNDLAPVSNGKINSADDLLDEQIAFMWDSEIQYLHGTESTSYSSNWCYDHEKDDWFLLEEKNPQSYIFCGYQIYEYDTNVSIDSNLNGNWTLESGSTFTISDFDGTQFTAEWDGDHYEFSNRVSIPLNFDTSRDNVLWYGDIDQNVYMQIALSDNNSTITLFSYSNKATLIGMGYIREELPDLAE